MFWCNFSFFGVGSYMPMEGMMNSDKYIDVIESKVIPDMTKAFPDGWNDFQERQTNCVKLPWKLARS